MHAAVMGRDLTLADRDRVVAGLAGLAGPTDAARAPAEHAFANLFLFRARHDYRIGDGPVPHLSGTTYDGLRHALPLVPLGDEVARVLLDNHDCLFPLGADAVAQAATLGLACRFEPADSDYIYDTAAMAALSGTKARRAQARAFAAETAPTLHAITPDDAATLTEVLEGWLGDIARDAAATDYAECRTAIAMLAPLGLEGALVRLGDGHPVAFLLASRRGTEEMIVHFAKGRRAFSGAYPWMFSTYAAGLDTARLNFEQDLGNLGFRQSKRAYAPAELRPKYRLLPYR